MVCFFSFLGEATDDQPFVSKTDVTQYDPNLYLYSVSFLLKK